jgi:hypothetical protein
LGILLQDAMRYLCYTFIFLLASSFRQEPKNHTLIKWQQNYLLKWDDFKGPQQHLNSVASTTYDILKRAVNKRTYARVEIVAVFYPYDSWHNKKREDKIILSHEQKHFDIAELFARKLRKKISGEMIADYADLQEKLQLLYEQNDKELERYQDVYDIETDYSRNIKHQAEWNEKIENELSSYSDFSSSSILIPFNSKRGQR